MKLHDTQAKLQERALLVGLEQAGHDRWAVQDSLEELAELARTAGTEVVASFTQRRNTPSAPTFIGRGKAVELAGLCVDRSVNTVIFDDDLSPAQGRNLGKILGDNVKVLDRTELILDIFAQRARTREGKIQVELAQLQYMLPRLTGLWTHLSRQRGGGVGTRGPGEQQLEVDRRRIQEKIARLRRQLAEVQKNRRIERSGRKRLHWPLASLVGYTNSGKSTLMRALTGARVLAEDKLFATLDPTTRKVEVGQGQTILLSDTVGFLRKLPHHLVESFKATLEEVVEADLLVHVVDISHPQAGEQLAAVEVVLREIAAWGKPTVMALNKIDRLTSSSGTLQRYLRQYPHAVAISARNGTNLTGLREEIANTLNTERHSVRLAIPHDQAALIARVYRGGHVMNRSLADGCVRLDVRLPKELLQDLEPYLVKEEP